MKTVRFDLTGNDDIKKYLAAAVKSGGLNHAYIIEGAEGSGKKTLVKQLLMGMACESDQAPCGKCGNCVKIADGVCVDVYDIKVPEGKSEITVDLIRGIVGGIMLSPNDLDFKAYIIHDADKMNQSASNALLKILEEPPTTVYFFLLTENASALLPTVRSRALTLITEKLGEDDIIKILKDNGIPDNEKSRLAAKLAAGSAGKAMEIYRGDGEIYRSRRLCDGIIGLLSDTKSTKTDFVTFHHKSFKKPDETAGAYSLLLSALRDGAYVRKGGESGFEYFTSADEAESFVMNISDIAAARMAEVVCAYLCCADIPFNHSAAMTEYSSRLWDAHLL